VLAALAVACVAAAGTADAQTVAKVNIDFAFVAAGAEMPAGAYEFEAKGAQVVIRAVSPKGKSAIMPVITRLGRHDNDPDPELVFDKVGAKLALSEVWFPQFDGFLVLNTPTDHEHRVLGGSHPHK